MEEGKEIVKKEEHPVLITVANALFKSGLFPNVKNAYGAFAITQYGSELGIGPMTALQTMAIVSGKICMGAQMMLSLAIKAGVSFKIIKDDNNECQIHFKRGELEYTSSFSIAEAKQAGIYRDQSGWTKYPRDMLYWRAVTRGLRRVCPDVITGLYAIEEIQDAIPLNAKVEEADVVGETNSEGSDQPPPASSLPIITSPIDNVTKREGEKNGKKFTVYTLHIGDQKITTFSETLAKIAKEFKERKEPAVIEYKQTKYGMELVSITPVGVKIEMEVEG